MKITLSCVGGCAQYVPGNGKATEVDVCSGDTLLTLLERMGIPSELFMFALVMGQRVDLAVLVHEGDDVVLVSAISGG